MANWKFFTSRLKMLKPILICFLIIGTEKNVSKYGFYVIFNEETPETVYQKMQQSMNTK